MRVEVDLTRVGKIVHDPYAVEIDSRQLDSLLLEAFSGRLQLNELAFAVRAPIGGAVKKKHGAFRASERIESLRLAKLVARGKVRSFLPGAESHLGKHLDGSNMNCSSFQSASDRDAVSQVTLRLILRVERKDLPDRVVIQSQRCAGRLAGAFSRLGECFIRVARSVDDHARPRTYICFPGLACQREGSGKKNCEYAHPCMLVHNRMTSAT